VYLAWLVLLIQIKGDEQSAHCRLEHAQTWLPRRDANVRIYPWNKPRAADREDLHLGRTVGGNRASRVAKIRSAPRARYLATLLLPLALGACLENEETRTASFDESVVQPFPGNYRPETIAFMRTYLNDPVGVREAALAEPVQRTVGGRVRYVSCLRFAERQADGTYRAPRERAILFINGRLDRVLPNVAEVCEGAVYAPFPELEKMTR